MQTIDRDMTPLAQAVGIVVMDEYRLTHALQPFHQQVVDHPVAKLGGGDFAALGLLDSETVGEEGAP